MKKFDELFNNIVKQCVELVDAPVESLESLPPDLQNKNDNVNEISDTELDQILKTNRTKNISKESSVVLPDETLKCEICGKEILQHKTWDKNAGMQYDYDDEIDFSCEDPEFQHEHICLDCAQKEARKYQERFINGVDENEHVLEFIDNKDGETWIACAGCGTLWPENQLKDTDAGYQCNDCIDGLASRGEDFAIYYNRDRY